MSLSNPLHVARQKLQTADVPFQLRVTYYLRVSCITLNTPENSYSNLLKALFSHNPDWLNTCQVTPMGHLQSSDRTIDDILSPIKKLHRLDLLTTSMNAVPPSDRTIHTPLSPFADGHSARLLTPQANLLSA